MSEQNATCKTPSLYLAVFLFLIVAAMISLTVLVLKLEIHITLIIGATIVGSVGVFYLGIPYAKIESGIIEGIMTGMQACFILYTVFHGTLAEHTIPQCSAYRLFSICHMQFLII